MHFVIADPIFPLRLVSSNCFAQLMDTIFQTLFITCILLSWLSLYHGLRQVSNASRIFITNNLIPILLDKIGK